MFSGGSKGYIGKKMVKQVYVDRDFHDWLTHCSSVSSQQQFFFHVSFKETQLNV